MTRHRLARFWGLAGLAFAAPVLADEDASKLAEKLSNPVSSLISVPFQFNYDCCFGPRNGGRVLLNIQPVVPFGISDNWNLIVRTITPVIDQEETVPRRRHRISASATSRRPSSFRPILIPAASSGPRVRCFCGQPPPIPQSAAANGAPGRPIVVLKQESGWTYGILANHIWSYSGEHERANVNSTFLQPFLSYTWPDTTGVTLNTESTYDWTQKAWSVPLNLSLSHIYKLGTQPISFQGGVRWYPATFDDGPRWGLRFNVVFLFPA